MRNWSLCVVGIDEGYFLMVDGENNISTMYHIVCPGNMQSKYYQSLKFESKS